MFKDTRKQKRFKSWDEAFKSLTPEMRRHSVRVADYTVVLFEGVCKSSYYSRNREIPVYMDAAYRDIAYKCGFYHQIGKALEPEYYPQWREDFSPDEKKEYCRYTAKGRELVAKLQQEGRETSLPNRMIQEACEQHMEYWDGSGFPYGFAGNDISLIAQITGLAKEMDRLVCQRKSENPYEEAVDRILEEENKKFSPNLMDVFRDCQTELRNVFKKYIQYTKIMPKTVPLVEKRPERPFGLQYRQIVSGEEVESYIFEATPWFGGITDHPEKMETAAEAEALLLRTGLTNEVTGYFLYEAADTLARIKNCDLYTGGILVPIYSSFYSGENQAEQLEKLYSDTGIDRKKLLLTVPESLLREDRKVCERLSEYIELGVALVLDDYHPKEFPVALLRKIGFTRVRYAKDADWMMQELKNQGITVIDRPSGETSLTEDELIHYLLNHESM